MIRESLSKKGIGSEPDFTWRGHEVTRIEGFSDAVFAFAMTLIVVSLEVPKTFNELTETMRGFLAFGTCFMTLMWIWYSHYKFFRRYGLTDTFTIVFTAVLLFVVLFYVFPLKFVFTFVINGLVFPGSAHIPLVSAADSGKMMQIYGVGFFLIFLIFGILHWHAYRLRESLKLDQLEIFTTRSVIQSCILLMGVAVVSMTLACSENPRIGGFLAGMTYGLIGPVLGIHGWRRGKKFAKLKKELNL
jgi:uncharacterized membrane protein